jgi:hypothetical protein
VYHFENSYTEQVIIDKLGYLAYKSSWMVEMSYQLDFKFEPDYLHIHATGNRSVENIISLTQDWIKEAEKHGYKKAILDVQSMTGELSTADAYDLGRKLPEKLGGSHPEIKRAIVDLEKNKERYLFVETVLANRGYKVRFFLISLMQGNGSFSPNLLTLQFPRCSKHGQLILLPSQEFSDTG